jgi:hypothetical protein
MAMEGTATRVKVDQEGNACVLRFVIVTEDGASTAVEMRGAEIRGVLGDGDRVLIDAAGAAGAADGLLHPRNVRNQTTESLVSVWQPPFFRRLGGTVGTLVISTVISTVVTSALGLIPILGSGEEGPASGGVAPGGGGGGGEGGKDWFPFTSPVALVPIVVLSLIIWGLWFAAFGRRKRRRGRVIWPVAPGIALGVTIGLWITALIDDFEIG